MKSKHFNRGARSYFRGGPQHETSSGKTILIVSEGTETEPQYFNALKNRLRLGSAVIVTASAQGTDPKSVVEDAKAKKKAREREARRGQEVAFDEVWCVFDAETVTQRPHLNAALDMAKANKIKVALSWPCFEFWLLLHETYTSAPFTDCASVERVLKIHYPNYQKNDVPTAQLLGKLVKAVVNARRLRADNAISARKEPATDVDLLTFSMNEATRLGLKYNFPPNKR